ncbi:MAG: DUF4143 domain-containing protein [Alloprevotella sp.]
MRARRTGHSSPSPHPNGVSRLRFHKPFRPLRPLRQLRRFRGKAGFLPKRFRKKNGKPLKALEDSKCVNMAYHANDPNEGMPIAANYDKFKMFVADTGLMVTMAFWDKDYTENVIYEKLLCDKPDANLGYIYENIIAQMLTASGNKLFYHTWHKKKEDGSIDDKHTYEIDFILSRRNKVCPIEVKSSGYKRHASLDSFCNKYSSCILNRYLVYTKDLSKEESILYVPIYMTPFL